ncbi:MAG: L-fucokinase [Eubacteriales bacterium]
MKSFSSANSQKDEVIIKKEYESPTESESSAGWDFVVITASNEAQAASYSKQIRYRIEKGLVQKNVRYEIVPDYQGKRAGSGGATFNVLWHIRESLNEDDCFSNMRILVIHSGGESIRIPQYSVCGKLFAPVQRELSKGISATLFDEILNSVKDLPSRCPAGMLTIAGDILLIFDPNEIDLKDCDAAAISACENIDTGSNHGVFIPNNEGNVKRFLHKFTSEELRKAGAQSKEGYIRIDTGAVWLASETVNTLYKVIANDKKIDLDKFEKFVNENERLSFYADLVYPFATDSTLEHFIKEKSEGNHTKQLELCRKTLFKSLHGYKMKLIELSKSTFIHFGSTAEFLELTTAGIKKYPLLSWESVTSSRVEILGNFTVNCSYIDRRSVVGEGSYIEKSRICNSKIGNKSIVSNISLECAEIPDKTVIHCLKQNDGDYVVRVYGVIDNPKKNIDEGGTFLGIPLRSFLKRLSLTDNDLWDNEPHDLWNAKLFYKSASFQKSLNYALSLCNASEMIIKDILRVSLRQSFENADVNYISFTVAEKN